MIPRSVVPPAILLGTLLVVAGCNPTLPPDAALTKQGDGGDAGIAGDASYPDGGVDIGVPEGTDGGDVTDGGEALDGGSSVSDAGTPGPDGGTSLTDAGSSPTDAGSAADAGQPIGGGCTGDSDCASGMCITQVSGGYCASNCGGNNAPCPSGSTCTQAITGQNLCLQNCSSQAQCRSGYACQPNQGVCNLQCQNSFECGGGLTCDTTTGQCVAFSSGCTSSADCPSGEVCDSASMQCIQTNPCQSNADCPTGETCDTAIGSCTTSTNGCESNSDCPAGQTCNTASGVCGGQIGDSCTASSDCRVGNTPACYTAAQGFPGGYCVSTCQNFGGGCASTDRCVSGLDPNNGASVCVSTCSTSADCRADYQCVPFQGFGGGAPGICMPPCTDNSVCAPQQQCDTSTGVCTGGGQTGGLNDGGM